MAAYRYFLSGDPSAPSPPNDELLAIDAASPVDAAQQIQDGPLPSGEQNLWANILIWTSPDGKQCGFQSFCLTIRRTE